MSVPGWCRALGRLIWLGGEFALAALRFPRHGGFGGEAANVLARGRWLQRGCQRLLRVLEVRVRVQGVVPTTGLLVCNHLGYLDVLVLGALAPATFVAKADVRRWPFLGWFTQAAGTVFVQRERRQDVLRANAALASLLGQGALVVLFPEGTSSGGQSLLPFKSSLLAPIVQSGCPISVGRLEYTIEEGVPERDVCYWGDMTLLPHLFKLAGKRGVSATVRFGATGAPQGCRKALAKELHAAVLALAEERAWLA